MTFHLDPRLSSGSHLLARLPLCEARLQDDTRYAWIVLIPARPGLVELADPTPGERLQLLDETLAAGEAVGAAAAALGRPVRKLNHGQLGNLVAQLHIHVVGRREDDPAWPGPVWGFGDADPYTPEELSIACAAAQDVLSRVT